MTEEQAKEIVRATQMLEAALKKQWEAESETRDARVTLAWRMVDATTYGEVKP